MKYSCKIVWFMEFYLHVTRKSISVVLVNYTKIPVSKVTFRPILYSLTQGGNKGFLYGVL